MRETIAFDDAAFRLVDQPTVKSLGADGSETTGRTLVTVQAIPQVAARVRFNVLSGLFEVVRGYGVASVVGVEPATVRVIFDVAMPDALYAPFVTPVRGDAPGNIQIPYDLDAHTGYCDVFFIDETLEPVFGSFVFRVDLIY
jgi:hypothetical protein